MPFATYLNLVHTRVHPIFSDGYLGDLQALPATHEQNVRTLHTVFELVLGAREGEIVQLEILSSSGVEAFDQGVITAVRQAAPFGAPPPAIVSANGNVYVHWEFHRDPELGCSTYFMRPFLLGEPSKSPDPPPK